MTRHAGGRDRRENNISFVIEYPSRLSLYKENLHPLPPA